MTDEFVLTEQEQKRVDALKEHDLLLCRIRRSHTMWKSVPVEKRTESACNAMMLLPAFTASIIVPSSIPRIVEALDYLEAFRIRLVQERQAEREAEAAQRRIEVFNSQDVGTTDKDWKAPRKWVDRVITVICGLAAIVAVYIVAQLIKG